MPLIESTASFRQKGAFFSQIHTWAVEFENPQPGGRNRRSEQRQRLRSSASHIAAVGIKLESGGHSAAMAPL